MSSPEAKIHFGGHWLVLNAQGALYWPAEKTLIVSDLHFEKGSFLARMGSFIPPYDTQDTLERLEQLIAHYQPERLILLGDSFHDRNAWARLDEPSRESILALASRVKECVWIQGNHDVALNEQPLGVLKSSIHVNGIHFAHEDSHPHRPVIIGHYHPKAKLRGVSCKCFIYSEAMLVMPSFGSYTGGLSIQHESMQNLFRDQLTKIHFLYRDCIYLIPDAANNDKILPSPTSTVR